MSRLLGRERSPKAPWQEVPKGNVLREERPWARRWVIRAPVTALLLAGVYMAGSLYWEGLAAQRDMERVSAQLKSVQGELAPRQSQLQQLQAQLQSLQQRQQEIQQMSPANVQWQPTLAALKEVITREGGRLESLEGGSEDEFTLVATVADQQALTRIHRGLQGAGQPFTVQVMEWQPEGGGFKLTASLQVNP